MTKEEFVAKYCKNSDITEAELISFNKIALPCNCDFTMCNGWAMIANDPESIRTHQDLYQNEIIADSTPASTHGTEGFKVFDVVGFTLYVCSALSVEETTIKLNDSNIAVTKIGKWRLDPSGKFPSGRDMPCACSGSPSTHKHYLFI